MVRASFRHTAASCSIALVTAFGFGPATAEVCSNYLSNGDLDGYERCNSARSSPSPAPSSPSTLRPPPKSSVTQKPNVPQKRRAQAEDRNAANATNLLESLKIKRLAGATDREIGKASCAFFDTNTPGASYGSFCSNIVRARKGACLEREPDALKHCAFESSTEGAACHQLGRSCETQGKAKFRD